MLDSNRVIKKHLNLAALAPQVVRKQEYNRSDEPNLPLYTLEDEPDLSTSPSTSLPTTTTTTTTTSEFVFSITDFMYHLAYGLDDLMVYLRRWFINLGLPVDLTDFLLLNVDWLSGNLFVVANWILSPGDHNLPQEVFKDMVWRILLVVSPTPQTTAIDDAAWETLYYFESRGLFFFGDLLAALNRGWTLLQILQYLRYLISRAPYYPAFWPNTWAEAEQEIVDDIARNSDNDDDSSGPDQFP
jgi:hypothetical protein